MNPRLARDFKKYLEDLEKPKTTTYNGYRQPYGPYNPAYGGYGFNESYSRHVYGCGGVPPYSGNQTPQTNNERPYYYVPKTRTALIHSNDGNANFVEYGKPTSYDDECSVFYYNSDDLNDNARYYASMSELVKFLETSGIHIDTMSKNAMKTYKYKDYFVARNPIDNSLILRWSRDSICKAVEDAHREKETKNTLNSIVHPMMHQIPPSF